MENSRRAAEKLRDFLKDIGKDGPLSGDASYALSKDTRYIEKTLKVLSEDNLDAIDALWREVQYLSQFFGGDYAEGLNHRNLLGLMDEFETALFEDIVAMRAK